MIYISELLSDSDMARLLRETGAGVELVRFSVGMNLDRLEMEIDNARRRLRAWGDPPCTVHGPFLDLNPVSWDPAVASLSARRYEQAYEAAAALGASKIVYHTCYVPATNMPEGWSNRCAAFYREFLKGKGASPAVVMENVFDPDPQLLREVAERVDHPAFGLCLDVGHAHCYAAAAQLSAPPARAWAEAGTAAPPARERAETGTAASPARERAETGAAAPPARAWAEAGVAAPPAHAWAEAGVAASPVCVWAAMLAPWIRHIHAHDNDGTADHHRGIGRGTIPWSQLRPLLPAEASVTIECADADEALESVRLRLRI